MQPARQCSSRRKDGRRCRAWATADSDPALCNVHRRPAAAENPAAEKPAAENPAAENPAAENPAVEKPARKPEQATTVEEGAADFYRRAYSMLEKADLAKLAAEGDLSDELSAARVAVRRVLQQLEEELSPAEYATMAGLIFRGTHTVAQLLRTQHDLSRDFNEKWARIMGQALDELGRERNVDL